VRWRNLSRRYRPPPAGKYFLELAKGFEPLTL
jgi:hypothetical protein